MKKTLLAALALLGIASSASGQFSFRTTGESAARIFTLRPTASSLGVPPLSDANHAKFWVPDAGHVGYSAGQIYISQNGGAWTLLSSFVGAGNIVSIFGRIGTVTAQSSDYDFFYASTGSSETVTGAWNLGSLATATTQASSDNDTSIATSALVRAIVAAYAPVLTVHGRSGAVVSASGDYAASQISYPPTGGLVAATVKAALDELDAEKAAIGNLPWLNVKDPPYSATCDGIVDDTTKIQNASNVVGPHVVLVTGECRTTATIVINQDRVHLVGITEQGKASRILFDPTSASQPAVSIEGASGGTNTQAGIRRISIRSATGNTQPKIGIRVTDGSAITMSDVTITGPSGFSGTGSVGLQIRGRDNSTYRNISVTMETGTPLSIEDNPNWVTDLDHVHFQDMTLMTATSSATKPVIGIASGVTLSSVTIDGDQAWVGGTDGLRWNDTTSTLVSDSLVVGGNVRWEQAGAAGGSAININHNTSLRNLSLTNIWTGGSTNFIRLRNAYLPLIVNGKYLGTGTCLDLDSTDDFVQYLNLYRVTGSTNSTSGMTLVRGEGKDANGFYVNGLYVSSTSPNLDTAIFLRKPEITDFTNAQHTHLTAATGGVLDIAAVHFNGGKYQNFAVAITNSSGTLQHRVIGEPGSATASAFADKVSGASATFANTPTVDASTGFTSGAGIESASTNRLLLNTAAQTNANFNVSCFVENNTTATAGIQAFCRTVSSNINGATVNRLAIRFATAAGATHALTTTNIGSGTGLTVRVVGSIE
jgi:hypothetical protein